MNIKTKTSQFREDTFQFISDYRETVSHTFEFLKDSKDFLEYKKGSRKIDENSYLVRLKSLINMSLVYFYSLYEGFTRIYFKTLMFVDFGTDKDEFDKLYSRFHDIIENLMKGVYKIFLPGKIFVIIMKLKEARNKIAHGEKSAKSEFAIVEISYQALMTYFQLKEKEINLSRTRLDNYKFIE